MDLAAALCSKDKSISYANMLDFVDRRMIQEYYQGGGQDGSEQRSTISRTNSVDMSYNKRSQQQHLHRSFVEEGEGDNDQSVEGIIAMSVQFYLI